MTRFELKLVEAVEVDQAIHRLIKGPGTGVFLPSFSMTRAPELGDPIQGKRRELVERRAKGYNKGVWQ